MTTSKQASTRKRGVAIGSKLLSAIRNVDEVYRGVGIPLALHYCVNKAGVSIMTIGTMGAGKGVIKSLLTMDDALSMDFDSVTKTDLAEKLGNVQDEKIFLRIEELAALSDYQRDILMSVLAKVITDRNYVSEASRISITNCELIMYCGVQPITFTQMIAQNKAWENLTSDRFIKILLVNGMRNSDIERFDIDQDWYASRQSEFNDLFASGQSTIECDEKALTIMQRLLMNQITGNRARIYAKKILQAWANMNGQPKGTVQLAQLFESMFGFYFKIFDTFTYRDDVGSNLKFKGAITATFMAIAANERFGYTRDDYVEMLRVDISTWKRNTSELGEMQLVDFIDVPVKTPAGKRNKKGYVLGGIVAKYFKYYKSLIEPTKKRKSRSTKSK